MQSFGEVQRLYTASRQRGLLLVVYYDLRSALAAAKRLQGYQVNGSPLELHFAAPKTVNGLDDCTVQIFNLDPDTTNEHLGWLLSKFGEVKGITESPNRRNQKFISFYDVRHATAAHKAMNRAELLTNLPADMTVQQVAHLSQIPEPAPNLLEIAAQMQSEPEVRVGACWVPFWMCLTLPVLLLLNACAHELMVSLMDAPAAAAECARADQRPDFARVGPQCTRGCGGPAEHSGPPECWVTAMHGPAGGVQISGIFLWWRPAGTARCRCGCQVLVCGEKRAGLVDFSVWGA